MKRRMTLRSGEDVGQEEVEELGLVPTAVSEPLWAEHMCDNKCSEQGFKFFQLAAIVTEEAGAVRTKHCHNKGE